MGWVMMLARKATTTGGTESYAEKINSLAVERLCHLCLRISSAPPASTACHQNARAAQKKDRKSVV